ncbi:MAG: pyruvate kinase [Anaerolineaceae bacterium]|jgi:pyruvate kinase|nr:pyruvate kinase [Anaerolineaceae bacterium]
MNKNAKIVATLGPSSNDKQTLSAMIHAGMDVARLNFSHGDHQEHLGRIKLIRQLSDEFQKPITILQDLQGPKLRVGTLPINGILLETGQKIILVPSDIDLPGEEDLSVTSIPMEVPNLVNNVSVGNRILLDDGLLELKITNLGKDFLEAEVILGGILKSHKGVNLPGSALAIPALTEKDLKDLEFGLEVKVDAVAISFVQSAEDVIALREKMKAINPARANIPIIAKLERPRAIENLDSILDVADGVMVARGDLAVETSPSQVPIMQKKIIEAANQRAKIVITATQMLDSMIHNPRPTRAEASDVANAVFDGTDAVMLSGETAAGAYPVESVAMMSRIIQEAENNFADWGKIQPPSTLSPMDDAISITRAARELAQDREVNCIAVFTQSGRTALFMSKARPTVPIIALTPDTETYQRLGLYWGVTAFLVPYATSVESMLSHIEAALIANTALSFGQQVVVIAGLPVGAMRPPNFTLLHTIGKSLRT